MNFEFTVEQEDIRKAAREFAQKEFTVEKAREFDLKEEFPFDIWKKACNQGFIAVHFPEKYGGQGLGLLEDVIIIEEFCRVDSTIGMAITHVKLGSEIILKHGNEEQKEKYLSGIPKGETISAAAFTEPARGSALSELLDTKASKKEDGYLINGTKTFISNALIANYFVVLCQTNPKISPPYRGQSILLVEKDTEGLEITPLKNKMGNRAQTFGELAFSDCYVSKDRLVGEENKGFYYTMEYLNESRVQVAAAALGMAECAFDKALNYAKERTVFGQKLLDLSIIQHKIAEMTAKIECVKLIVYKAAWLVDKGKPDPLIASVAKLEAARTATYVANEAIQILGGYGYMADQDVERIYRDTRGSEIYEGTNEIQKNTIANWLIKRIGKQ